ncbi:MAG: TasA family protein [Dehalococcoidales bacterium]|nr:TasA family protein [Dehalococcoidales bacterium]
MKKYLLLLSLAAVLVAGAAASGTFALFSDTETSEGNVFTAGTIDLAVNEENPWSSKIDANLKDLEPGMYDDIPVTLTNVSSNPMDVWMRVTNIETDGGLATYPSEDPVASSQPEYEAEGGPGSWAAIDDIDSVISLALDLGNQVTDYEILYIDSIKDKWIYLDNLGSLGYRTGSIGFKLDAGAGDQYQGDTMTFDIEFFAQQSEGDTQPDPPEPELSGYGRT